MKLPIKNILAKNLRIDDKQVKVPRVVWILTKILCSVYVCFFIGNTKYHIPLLFTCVPDSL